MTAKTGLRLAVLVAAVLMLTASASALEAGLEPEGAIEPGEALRYTGGGSPDAIYWWVYTGEFGENERIFDHGSGVTFMPSSRLEKGKEYKVMVYSEDVDAGEKDTAKSSFIIKKEKTKSDVQIQAPGQGSPEAIINAEKNSVTEGEMLKLSAEESYSPNGDIAEYRWKIGEEVKKGKTIAPKFFQPGTRTVELTITDSQGETATATKKIKIGKEEEKFVHAQIMDAEDGEAVSSIKAIKGKTMHLEADTTDLPPNVTYRWKIGSNQDYIKNPDKKGYRTVSKGSDRFAFSHEFSEAGTYRVKLEVAKNGETASDVAIVNVEKEKKKVNVSVEVQSLNANPNEVIITASTDPKYPESAVLEYTFAAVNKRTGDPVFVKTTEKKSIHHTFDDAGNYRIFAQVKLDVGELEEESE